MRDAKGLGFLRQAGELSGESSKGRPGYFGWRVRPSDFLPSFLPSRDSTYLAGRPGIRDRKADLAGFHHVRKQIRIVRKSHLKAEDIFIYISDRMEPFFLETRRPYRCWASWIMCLPILFSPRIRTIKK